MEKIQIKVSGMPQHIREDKKRLYSSRIIEATKKVLDTNYLSSEELEILFTNGENAATYDEIKTQSPIGILPNESDDQAELDFQKRAEQYTSKPSFWQFQQLILPLEVIEEIELALSILEHEPIVFDNWGLRAFEPYARTALNFYGPPGTGKTMAAHAIASKFGKKILAVSYAHIESKYHGDGPKNVESIFLAAERDNSVLFIDEADSLLSKRLTNVTQGSEQAINSMRSQLLICLEKFQGIVIFATNLVKNYDYAFETRVKHIQFSMPDIFCREKIWDIHLISSIPKDNTINIKELAEMFPDFCGRDIKNAVINACLDVVQKGCTMLSQVNLINASQRIVTTREKLKETRGESWEPLSQQEKEEIESQIPCVINK